ncbi:hypothetical protein MCHI_003085 [Candidatus Magnetoovum chiemensis]|nr:hypothetical protein MCHI_003085 [Candidatus Magnetoovum chiemensis]
MAEGTKKIKQVTLKKTFMYSVVSVALYVLLLVNQDIVNDYFARGGMYALLPILTAFAFSFFHGNFTGGFWSLLGVEAKKERR